MCKIFKGWVINIERIKKQKQKTAECLVESKNLKRILIAEAPMLLSHSGN